MAPLPLRRAVAVGALAGARATSGPCLRARRGRRRLCARPDRSVTRRLWLGAVVAVFLALRLGTLLTAAEKVAYPEETERGTIAKALVDGVPQPLWSLRPD